MGVDCSLTLPVDMAIFAHGYYDIVKDMTVAEATSWFMGECPERHESIPFTTKITITTEYLHDRRKALPGERTVCVARTRDTYEGEFEMPVRRRFMAWRGQLAARRAMLAFNFGMLIMKAIDEAPHQTPPEPDIQVDLRAR